MLGFDPLPGRSRLAVTVLAALILAACTYRGNIDEPLVQKFAWFSLLNGDDLREGCTSGESGAAGDRYRFVYNARYTKHVRVYDLAVSADGSANLTSRVQLAENFSRIVIEEPGDLLSPWRWTTGNSALNPDEMAKLSASLEASGLDDEPPVGTWLDSRAYYWLAVGCRQGAIVFNAWPYPSDRFERLSFPEVLEGFDRTGIPLPPPREVDPSGRIQARSGLGASEFSGVDFEVQVGESGLSGQR